MSVLLLHAKKIITRAQASARTAAALRRLHFDDDALLLDAAQAGGDEVRAENNSSDAKLELELERSLLPAKQMYNLI